MPTWKIAVHEAVAALDTGKGASLASIKKYLTVQYNLDGTSHHLAAALKKAETAKTMVKVKASYKMVTAAKRPAKAKPASKAKPAAEPAASKKPTAKPIAKPIAKPTAKSAAKAAAAPRAEEEETDEEMAIGKDVEDAPLAVGESCVVMGDSGEYYEVTRDTATVWHCQCKAFKFMKKDKLPPSGLKTCKHIEGIKSGEFKPEEIKSAPPLKPKPVAAASSAKETKEVKKSGGKGKGKKKSAAADVEDDPSPFSFASLKIPQLKDALRNTQQLLSGSKDELVARCEERYENGALEKCSVCGGGNYKQVAPGSARWQCAGYHDGDGFIMCGESTTAPPRKAFAIPSSLRALIPLGPTEEVGPVGVAAGSAD